MLWWSGGMPSSQENFVVQMLSTAFCGTFKRLFGNENEAFADHIYMIIRLGSSIALNLTEVVAAL